MFSTTACSTPGEALTFEQCDAVADPRTYSDKCDSPHLEEVKSHQWNAECLSRHQSPSDLFDFATLLFSSG